MTGPTFGALLRRYRLRARKTQSQLARAMGVDFTYVSKIEQDKAPPPARERIDKAGKFLGLSDIEELDLFRAADKVPSDVQDLVIDQSKAAQLYRKIQKAPAGEQEAILDDLIRRVESRFKKRS